MGVLTKGRHKLTIGSRLFVWWVGDDPDGAGHVLHVSSEDKRFHVHYRLWQRGEREPFVVVLGQEFPGGMDPTKRVSRVDWRGLPID